VPYLTLHGLRRTYAAQLLATGTNPRVVSERLGHANVAFTLQVYGHALPGQQETLRKQLLPYFPDTRRTTTGQSSIVHLRSERPMHCWR